MIVGSFIASMKNMTSGVHQTVFVLSMFGHWAFSQTLALLLRSGGADVRLRLRT